MRVRGGCLEPLGVVRTAHLFAGLHRELLRLLRSRAPEDGARATAAGAWQVRDVVAHLLDGDLRRLSVQRDGVTLPAPDAPISGYDDIVKLINSLNADWVRLARRLSPRVMTELLAVTGPRVARLFRSLDPLGPAVLGVAWAGQSVSPVWLDTGREYTEKWHHQAQLRDAVGAPPLDARRWLHPVLEVSMWVFGRAFRGVAPREGALLVEVTGRAGGVWSVLADPEGWRAWRGRATDVAARVTLDADTAWRLLFNALPAAEARRRVRASGDRELVDAFLAARAVMV